MSDPFEFDSDGLDFNDRTTRDSFNERLLRAKEDSEKDLDSRIVRKHSLNTNLSNCRFRFFFSCVGFQRLLHIRRYRCTE